MGQTELARLQRQMAELEPGTLLDMVERAAPMVAKAMGYAEMIRAVLPDKKAKAGTVRVPASVLDPASGRALAPAPAVDEEVVAVPVVQRSGWRETWRNRLIGAGAGVVAVGVGYAVLRYKVPSLFKPLRLLDGPRTP